MVQNGPKWSKMVKNALDDIDTVDDDVADDDE